MNMARMVNAFAKDQTKKHFETAKPLIALFALPKAFDNPQTNLIQGNAIRSWLQLAPAIEVILFGNDYGIEEFAEKNGITYGGGLCQNKFGTPILSDAFRRVHELARSEHLMYSNCDVIFRPDLIAAAERLIAYQDFQRFVAFGQRCDLRIDRTLDLSETADQRWLETQLSHHGEKSSIVCKEYFLFSRGVYESIPDFAVGRGNWDNWMIYQSRQRGVPVVNASESITAIHQTHDYRHLKTSRLGCYVTCPEAKENQKLAGGRHVVAGSCGTWRITSEAISPIQRASLNLDFWRNIATFSKMILKLPFER